MSIYPSILTPLGATVFAEGIDENLWYTSPTGGSIFYLKGGLSPLAPGVPGQDGMVCKSTRGFSPPFKHLDLQAAQQDGATWTSTVYDPAKITLELEAHATTPQGLTRLVDEWQGSWDPRQQGTLEHYTPDGGFWYAPVRLESTWMDTIKYDRRYLYRPITTVCRIDDSFWRGVDSTDSLNRGYVVLTQTGTQPGWPFYTLTGPGTFYIQDGPGSGAYITIGPVGAGTVWIVTNPQFRTAAPWINGRFSNPIPGVPTPSQAVSTVIFASGTSGSIQATLTPLRIAPA